MKNHVGGDHYILMSKAFHDQPGDVEGLEAHWASETYDIETIEVAVYYPNPDDVPAPAVSFMQRLGQFWRFDSYMVRRMLGGQPHTEFRNLPK